MAEKNQKKDRGDDKDRSHKKDRHSDRGSDRRGDDSSRRGRSRARRTETKSRSRDRRRRSVEAPGKAVLRPASAEAATTAGGAEKRPEAMASEPAPPGKSAPVVEPDDDDDDDEESAEEEAPRAEDAEVEDGPRSTVPKAVTVDSDENECTASTAKAATTEGPAGLKKPVRDQKDPQSLPIAHAPDLATLRLGRTSAPSADATWAGACREIFPIAGLRSTWHRGLFHK